jgi:hypothetical protein
VPVDFEVGEVVVGEEDVADALVDEGSEGGFGQEVERSFAGDET